MANALPNPGPDGPSRDPKILITWNEDPREDRGDYFQRVGESPRPARHLLAAKRKRPHTSSLWVRFRV